MFYHIVLVEIVQQAQSKSYLLLIRVDRFTRNL
jgi:hypothetical protein